MMKDKMSDKRESRLGKGLSALLGDMEFHEPERKPVGQRLPGRRKKC